MRLCLCGHAADDHERMHVSRPCTKCTGCSSFTPAPDYLESTTMWFLVSRPPPIRAETALAFVEEQLERMGQDREGASLMAGLKPHRHEAWRGDPEGDRIILDGEDPEDEG